MLIEIDSIKDVDKALIITTTKEPRGVETYYANKEDKAICFECVEGRTLDIGYKIVEKNGKLFQVITSAKGIVDMKIPEPPITPPQARKEIVKEMDEYEKRKQEAISRAVALNNSILICKAYTELMVAAGLGGLMKTEGDVKAFLATFKKQEFEANMKMLRGEK